MMDLKKHIEEMDKQSDLMSILVYTNGNDGDDRDLNKNIIESLFFVARQGGWYNKSFWVTGVDTEFFINRIYGNEPNPLDIIDNRVSSLYGRPLIIDDEFGLAGTIKRLYLVNYGSSDYLGAVARDLQ